MSIRTDFTIDWDLSPRVITIVAPSTECTMQDLHDTLRYMEANALAMDNKSIVDSSGKETLDTTTKVGLTVTLQNAIIGFEARPSEPWVTCSFIGGNLVAINTDGETMVSTNPTAYVSISKTSSASATLQEQEALQYSSYGNFVTINETAGSSGTEFPIGTLQYPSNNITDTLQILNYRGFQEINVIGDLEVGIEGIIEDIILTGQSVLRSRIVLLDEAETNNVEISTATISGVLDGSASIRECLIDGISYVSGYLVDCGLTIKPIVLGNNAQASLINCFSNVSGSNTPTIDMGGSGQSLAVRDYSGGLKLINRTGTDPLSIDMDSGHVIIDSTCTAGTITVRGSFKLTDNSGSGCTVDTVGRVAMESTVPTATEIATETLTLDVSCP